MVMQSLRNGIVNSAVFALGQVIASHDEARKIPGYIRDILFSGDSAFSKEVLEGLGVMKTQWLTTCSATDVYGEEVTASVEGVDCGKIYWSSSDKIANWQTSEGHPAWFINSGCSSWDERWRDISGTQMDVCPYPRHPTASTEVNWVEDTDSLWHHTKNLVQENEWLHTAVVGFADFANQSPDSLEGMLIATIAKMIFQHVTNEHFKDSYLPGKVVQLILVNALGVVVANACGFDANLSLLMGCDLVSNIARRFI